MAQSRGGFSSAAQTDAARRSAEVAAALRAALPLDISTTKHKGDPATFVLRFEVRPADRGWTASGVCTRATNGGIVIGRLTVEPSPERANSGVTAAALREIPLAKILDAVQLEIEREYTTRRATELTLGAPAARSNPYTPADAEKPRRGGRPALSDDVLRQVALDYIALTRDGHGRVLERLGEKHGRPKETMRDWVRAARTREWLGPARQGVAHGTPGARLLLESKGQKS